MVKVYAWTDSGLSAQEVNRDHETSGSTYGPSLARRLYHEEVHAFALGNVDHHPAEPVAMTIQWHRAADPTAGFFD
jgi:hypothetical protein